MTDIVERLRDGSFSVDLCREAADEIERLRERVAALQASSGYEASIAQVEIERLRALLTTYTAANGEELPKGSAGTTIVNDGRPT